MEEKRIAVRCYAVPSGTKRPRYGTDKKNPSFDRYMVLDTETTADERQSLKFGSAIIVVQGKVRHGFIYYDARNISPKEMRYLNTVASETGRHLLSKEDFIEKVLLPEIYDSEIPLVGFNLPFDLSRFAMQWTSGKKDRKSFSFKLSPNYPNLNIRHIDSKRAFIKFNNGRPRNNQEEKAGGSRKFPGHFADLRRITFALTNESFTLDRACKRFGVPKGKQEVKEHGKISPEYIQYNLNDVEITNLLFQAVQREYDKYHLDLPMTELFSPASFSKAYLKQIGISPFLEKDRNFPPELMGDAMESYFGGRTEVRMRLTPISIVLLDFLSMYPTICGILNMWQYVIADHLEFEDITDEAIRFVDDLKLEDLRGPEKWRKMAVLCTVLPEDDVFMVRSDFNGVTYNIGTERVTSIEPLMYTLFDVVASKLITGRTPRILQAHRIFPVAVEPYLQPVTILGGQVIDPGKDDFFMALACLRNEYKEKMRGASDLDERQLYDSIQNGIKILLNAASYGIFIQLNTKDENAEVRVYGHGSPSTVGVKKVERPGPSFNPIIATFVTAGARLVLACTEAILAKHDAIYAFCDTDSMAVPPEHVDEIQEFFRPLSPYPFNAELFKLEEYNFNPDNGETMELWFYGISDKRYVLYNIVDGKIIIRKASSHGLGHILCPFQEALEDVPDGQGWEIQVWRDILNEHYGHLSAEELSRKYSDLYAISKFMVSSPALANRLCKLNRGKDYNDQIKPFNFCLVGLKSYRDPYTGKEVKPIAPFTKRPQEAVHSPFMDYNSGKVLSGEQYWKSMDDVYFEYKQHPEAKFDGNIGLLTRKHIRVISISMIGKETNDLERSQYFGVGEEDLVTYGEHEVHRDAYQELCEFIMAVKPRQVSRFHIGEKQLDRWRATIHQGKTLRLYRKTRQNLEWAMMKLGHLKYIEHLEREGKETW